MMRTHSYFKMLATTTYRQRTKAFGMYRRLVDKDVGAAIFGCNESKSFLDVKPFYVTGLRREKTRRWFVQSAERNFTKRRQHG
jgi:hypothetical protein